MKAYLVNRIDFNTTSTQTILSTFDREIAVKLALSKNDKSNKEELIIFTVSECEHVDSYSN